MLQLIVDRFVYSVLKLPEGTRVAQGLSFFLYDVVKILFLLSVMIFTIGFLRTFLPAAKVKSWISGKKGCSHFFAALFGAVTPFCSCSSIPIYLSFWEAGLPLGVSFSFLVTSPMINEYLLVLMLGFFGWKITLAYLASGLLIGTFTGMILGRMNLERYVEKDIFSSDKIQRMEAVYPSLGARLRFGLSEAKSVVGKIWVWIIVGVGVGALIHNFVPEASIQTIIGRTGGWSVPIATLLGVPMYGSCAAILPIAFVLFQKGFPLGTALSFMMAVSALSLPEAIILRRAMKLELILIFFGITTLGIIFTGYLFNFLEGILI